MRIIAIDPGTTHSGYVVFNTSDMSFTEHGKIKNEDLAERMAILLQTRKQYEQPIERVIIENITPQGVFGKTTIETCKWLGRFDLIASLFLRRGAHSYVYINRSTVKKHLLGKVNGMRDTHVRKAVIQRIHPNFSRKNPGPLAGVTKDTWSALALALVYTDQLREAEKELTA